MSSILVNVASLWGLTVSLLKTKGLSIGADSCGSNIVLENDGTIEVVDNFPYLGSILHRDGTPTVDVRSCIAKASRVFGELLHPIFNNSSLSLQTKQLVYTGVVIPTLLYGSETWAVKATDLRRLNIFHHQCVRATVGVSRRQQWGSRITNTTLAEALGVCNDIGEYLRMRRLRWLGHIARMDDRLPIDLLFGELEHRRPQHKPKKPW